MKKTLSIAESCTGGLLGHRITEVPGSSTYFKGGIIAYSNEIKVKILRVPKKIIKKFGAVSPQVAQLMAQNVRKIFKTDLGLSITGIAGPSGSSKSKPVGLVYIACANKSKTICKRFNFSGPRSKIKWKAAQKALDLIHDPIPS